MRSILVSLVLALVLDSLGVPGAQADSDRQACARAAAILNSLRDQLLEPGIADVSAPRNFDAPDAGDAILAGLPAGLPERVHARDEAVAKGVDPAADIRCAGVDRAVAPLLVRFREIVEDHAYAVVEMEVAKAPPNPSAQFYLKRFVLHRERGRWVVQASVVTYSSNLVF